MAKEDREGESEQIGAVESIETTLFLIALARKSL
jgi:hypothetical protein